MDVESTAEADGDGSHLAATSAEGKNKSQGRERQERVAEGTSARENDKVRVEGTTARESGGVGSGGRAAEWGVAEERRSGQRRAGGEGERGDTPF